MDMLEPRWTGLKIGAWIALNDATLTQNFPPAALAGGTYGISGDRLPNGSRFSGNLSLEQDFPMWGGVTGFVAGEVSYIGERVGSFQATSKRQNIPGYAKTDVRAGLNYDSWTANVFVNNVMNRRGLLDGGLDYSPPFAFVYIQPRTVGLSAVRKF
jgi:iron complex outermembrane receptor protein